MLSHLRVLRHPDFRYLFLGQTASSVGDQVVIVALALYITQRYRSATDLGLVLLAQTVPFVALLLFGGVWADRLERHRSMIAADVVRFGLHGALAVLILAGSASIPAMMVIEAVFGAARAFFQPAYAGLLPETVHDGEMQEARALTSSTGNLAILVGPALGTAMTLGLGAGAAFALDALTFLVSAGLLGRVRPRARAGVTAGRASVWSDLRGGWQEVRSRPWVWVTIVAFTGALLCAYAPWYSLAPIITRDHYGGAGLFGVLESMTGAGALAGSVIGLRWRPRRPMRAGLTLMLMWPLMNGVLALTAPAPAVLAVAFGAGIGFSLFGVWWETALARNIPSAALGRVSSYDWMGSLALLPLGFAIAGPIAAATSPQLVLGGGAAITFGLLAAALLPRSTRELAREDSAEELAGDVGEERGREAEVAHVDPLIGAVHQRRGFE